MLAHQGLLGDLVIQHCQPKKVAGQNSGNRLGRASGAKSKIVANGTAGTNGPNQKSPSKGGAGGRKKKGRNKCRKRK